MKIKWIIIGLFFWGFTTAGFAHPPSDIILNYDPAAKTLHVNIKHISYDSEKTYIRKIVMVKNSEAPKEYLYRRQNTRTEINVDFPLDVKVGDVIKLAAYCKDGGSKEVTLTITKDILEKGQDTKAKPSSTENQKKETPPEKKKYSY